MMKYASAAAFRTALEQRLLNQSRGDWNIPGAPQEDCRV
jgi:hypothetical protein